MTDPAGTFGAVSVTAHVQIDAILLGIIGRNELDSTGQAVARPVSGISEPASGKVSASQPPSVAPVGGGAAPPTRPRCPT